MDYVTREKIVERMAGKYSLPITELLGNVECELPLELKTIIPKKRANRDLIFPLKKRTRPSLLQWLIPSWHKNGVVSEGHGSGTG